MPGGGGGRGGLTPLSNHSCFQCFRSEKWNKLHILPSNSDICEIFESDIYNCLCFVRLKGLIHEKAYLCFCMIKTRGGHAQLFFDSARATTQLEGCTSAIRIPQLLKEMLLRNSAIAIFSEVRNFKSATWELYFRNFWQILVWSSLKLYLLFIVRCFLLLRGFNGTVARDFRPLFTCKNYSTQG